MATPVASLVRSLPRLAVTAALVAFATAPLPAGADSFYCIIHNAPFGVGSWLCAGTETTGAIGWNPVVVLPDAAGTLPVSAASVGSNGGIFAGSASAESSAQPGRLSAHIEASAFGSGGNSRASGGAQATFYEIGTLAPLAGATPGTPVALRLTIDVPGAFAAAASADGQLTIHRGIQQIFNRNIFLSSIDGDLFEQFVIPGVNVGDTLAVYMEIRASGSAVDTGPTSSAGDVGVASAFLDVTSSNAVFAATSHHDYRTAPEPDGATLVGVGVIALSLATTGSPRRRA